MDRRAALHSLMSLPLAYTSASLWAAPAVDARLLFVFLRGGYDAANVLVPISSSYYYETRPNIAIARPRGQPTDALPLDANWGLHPALRDSVFPMYQSGELAFLPFAGIDDLSRSHFETQDNLELGQPMAGARNFRSGFLNRLAAELQGTRPIAFTDQLPLAMQGTVQVPNVALRNLAKPSIDARQARIIASMYEGSPLARSVAEGFAVRDDVMRDMAAEMEAANRNAITAKGFELEARRIAKLMKDKYTLGFVDIGGWDTHVGQGGASGYLASRLDELGRGLAGFAQEMGPHWRNTVVVVVSEFGRTFRENGNRGTDHGHGTVYWFLGGAVRGGRIAGEQQTLTPTNLFQNRDYPILNEYRTVLGGLFAQMYGLDEQRLQRIFSGAKPRDLGLM